MITSVESPTEVGAFDLVKVEEDEIDRVMGAEELVGEGRLSPFELDS